MKSVFRKSALDKISSPDQLDKVLKVTSPMSWLALLGITLIIVYTVYWSFTGYLPSTVTASGVIVSSHTSTNTVLSNQKGKKGTVQRVARLGAEIKLSENGTDVLELTTEDGNTEYVKTDFIGTVSEVLVGPGSVVESGTEILRMTPAVTKNQAEVVVCFVPISMAEKIKRGMDANISLDYDDSNSYGHMSARVVNVDTWVTTQKAISAVVGTENNMANEFSGEGKGVCAVSCELLVDPSTANGYYWSNEKGRSILLTAPQRCSVRIITEKVHPIEKLFAKLRDIWENK